MAEPSRGDAKSDPVQPAMEAGSTSRSHSEDAQRRTEKESRNRNSSRRQQSGFDRPYRGRPIKPKGSATEDVSKLIEKGRRTPLKDPSTPGEADVTFHEKERTINKDKHIVKESTLTPSSGNEPEIRLPGKYTRKHGQKENPESNHTSVTSGWPPERAGRSLEKPVSRLNTRSSETAPHRSKKTTSKNSPGMVKPILDSKQGLPESHNKKAFLSHGTVTEAGVYVRRNKSGYYQAESKIKQSTSTSVEGQEGRKYHGEHKAEESPSHEKPAPHFLEKRAVRSMPRVNRIPGTLDKVGQGSMQASVLIEQLTDEKYECMVCCDVIKCSKAVWFCSSCYNIFHLFCIKRWARSPAALVEDGEGKSCGWRCPACQFAERNVPNVYTCFCGKVEEPKWYQHDGITPHSCGELCLKKRVGRDCPHPCNQLCHPGPCPSCPVTITKQCCCGKTTVAVRCGNSSNLTCSSVCGKTLNCGIHTCQKDCHLGCCEMCSQMTEQSCHCGKCKKEADCGTGSPTFINGKPGYFSCDAICSKKLDCGNHECDQICHPSECNACKLQPSVVVSCPCGKLKILDLLNGSTRNSCLDQIPTCGNPCECILPCAQYNDMTKASSEHRCKKPCHHGDCSTCEGNSIMKCRCRATSKKLPCSELTAKGEPFLCELKCNKKLHCGRHRCIQKCCPGTEHRCNLTCGKRLKCGKHKCMEPCHSGTCPPCLMAGFDEVFCPCGATVQEPPIPCGKPSPICNRPCARMHPCQHEVDHYCHYEEQCPPCTILVSKWCMGEHKLRCNIPCHIDSVSCGEQCGKALPCGKHQCLKTCHKGSCFEENKECKQLCVIPRGSCGHACDATCHSGECPKNPCKSKIRVYCNCRRKSEDAVCLKGGDKLEAAQAYQRFTTKNLAEKIKGLQGGQTVDISDLMNLDERKSQLDCDENCAVEQRNRIVAEALGIAQPDFSCKADSTQFPYFLEEHGRANMKLLYFVEQALENLVKAVTKVHSPKLTHSFAPMNNKNRRFVHELAAFYGCSSISYDQEPNRNTVVTATKESRCPRVKLSSHIQRQINPQPPPPVPVLPDEGIGNVKFIPRKSFDSGVVDYFAGDF